MSICYDCFKLKLVKASECPHGIRLVRCEVPVFRKTLSINHPFITVTRRCPYFDGDEEEE